MGKEITYECKHCGHRFTMTLGCGMMFPSVYESLVADVREGKFGEEWKDAFEQTEWAALSAETKLFWCEECGAWEIGPDLSIWAPKDLESYRDKEFGGKRMRFFGSPQSPIERELWKDFRLVKRRAHLCKSCGKRLHACLDESKAPQMLKCPDCGGKLSRSGWTIMWD